MQHSFPLSRNSIYRVRKRATKIETFFKKGKMEKKGFLSLEEWNQKWWLLSLKGRFLFMREKNTKELIAMAPYALVRVLWWKNKLTPLCFFFLIIWKIVSFFCDIWFWWGVDGKCKAHLDYRPFLQCLFFGFGLFGHALLSLLSN